MLAWFKSMVLHVVGLGPNLTNIMRLRSALHSLRSLPAHDSDTNDIFDKNPNLTPTTLITPLGQG